MISAFFVHITKHEYHMHEIYGYAFDLTLEKLFTEILPCYYGPCKNGAGCINNGTEKNGYTCNCKPGYTGSKCGEGEFFRSFVHSFRFLTVKQGAFIIF